MQKKKRYVKDRYRDRANQWEVVGPETGHVP
jgi:hypothetical protein